MVATMIYSNEKEKEEKNWNRKRFAMALSFNYGFLFGLVFLFGRLCQQISIIPPNTKKPFVYRKATHKKYRHKNIFVSEIVWRRDNNLPLKRPPFIHNSQCKRFSSVCSFRLYYVNSLLFVNTNIKKKPDSTHCVCGCIWIDEKKLVSELKSNVLPLKVAKTQRNRGKKELKDKIGQVESNKQKSTYRTNTLELNGYKKSTGISIYNSFVGASK